MRRLDQWPEKLAEHWDATAGMPGAWGTRDCATAFFDAVAAITGEDLIAEFRGRYTTELGAAKLLRKQGCDTIEQFAEKLFRDRGIEELPTVRLAGRGDAVVLDTQDGPALGMVALDGMHAITVSLEAAVAVPLAQCRRAWRI